MRTETLAFRITPDEKQQIEALATRLGRTPSDAARAVVLAAAQQMTRPTHEGEEIKNKNENNN